MADNRVVATLKAGFKQIQIRFGNASSWFLNTVSGSAYNYTRAVGDPLSNAAVFACINWEQTTFPEAPPMIYRKAPLETEREELPDHPLLKLLENPNPFYSGEHLWAATVADRRLSGNAYWFKVRSPLGRVVQLYWIPSTLVEPRWRFDSGEFIEWYDYSPDGYPIKVDVRDVVHFRIGFDPRNLRKGLSPFYALMREVATDNEAANMVASLLRNAGVPGLVIAPASGADSLDPDETKVVKEDVRQRFTGDRRGEPLVFGAPTQVQMLAFSPKQMEVRELRRIPEERISAACSVPAIVAGLGAGLDRSTFSNMAEARLSAYESNIIPTQRLLGSEVETQLVPDFDDSGNLRFGFDLTRVRILQPDEDAIHARARADWTVGMLPLNRVLEIIGEDPVEGDAGNVVLIPNTVSPMLQSDLLALREQAARVTVPDPNAQVPQPTTDPNDPNAPPADQGATITPAGAAVVQQPPQAPPKKSADAETVALVQKLLATEPAIDEEMAEAVLKVLGDPHPGVTAAEHSRIVIAAAKGLAEELAGVS